MQQTKAGHMHTQRSGCGTGYEMVRLEYPEGKKTTAEMVTKANIPINYFGLFFLKAVSITASAAASFFLSMATSFVVNIKENSSSSLGHFSTSSCFPHASYDS